MDAVNIGYLLILVALGLAAYLVIQYRLVKKVAHWPQADAVIESVRIRGSRGGSEPSWSIAVTFTFLVGDKIYTGNRLYAGPPVINPVRETVFGLERKYKEEEPIRISYNPANPSYAVIYTGENPTLGLISVGTGIIMLVGIFLVWGIGPG